MPTGKLIDPGGDAQVKKETGLGTILGTDRKYYLFKNEAKKDDLIKGDPVVFDLICPVKINLGTDESPDFYDIEVARLHKNSDGEIAITSNWEAVIPIEENKTFKELWDYEWTLNKDNIDELELKETFKKDSTSFHGGLKNIKNFEELKGKRPNPNKQE